MGLAPYGEPGVKVDAFIDPVADPYRVHWKRRFGNGSGSFSGIAPLLGPARAPESEIGARHKNIAYAVQDACEIAMLSVVRMAVEKTRIRNLCLAGGGALESKGNRKIAASRLVDHILVEPATSGEWTALG